jgi:hypothetical protein
MIKLRRLRWTGRVARVGDKRGACRVLIVRPEGRNHLEDLGVDGMMMMMMIIIIIIIIINRP